MTRYLDLARSAALAEEGDGAHAGRPLKRPHTQPVPSEGGHASRAPKATTGYGKNGINGKSPWTLSRNEALALGLDPQLTWIHVSRKDVELDHAARGLG